MSSIVRAVYFSPTRTTKTIVQEVAGALAAPLDASVEAVSLTLPAQRPADVSCAADDVLVFGFPVYAGRVPVLLRDEFAHLEGRGTPAVVVGLYGNRAFDDALLEAADLLEERGFNVTAAGAFIGEHSLTARVGTGRPDDADIAVAQRFGADLGERLAPADPPGSPRAAALTRSSSPAPTCARSPRMRARAAASASRAARSASSTRTTPRSWEPDASTAARASRAAPRTRSASRASRPTR